MTEKWADYVITAVRIDDKNVIQYLEVREDRGHTLASGETWSRSEVVNKINGKRSFVTATLNKATGNWERGARVRVFRNYYLRTDDNQIAADNLGNLPKF